MAVTVIFSPVFPTISLTVTHTGMGVGQSVGLNYLLMYVEYFEFASNFTEEKYLQLCTCNIVWNCVVLFMKHFRILFQLTEHIFQYLYVFFS